MAQIDRRNRIPVTIGIPFDLLNILDEKVMEQNIKSRSDLVVTVLKEKFQTIKK